MKKRISTIIALVLCLACVLSACGTKEPAATETQAAAPAETQAAAVETQAAETENPSAVDWEDMAEIEYYYFTFVPPADLQHIEDAINAITEVEINTHVNLNVLEIGSYIAQMGVMIAGGEQIDLLMCGFASASYSAFMSQRQLQDISGYLEDYGQDILATLGHMLPAVSEGDAIYGVPTYRNNASSYYAFMRQDVLEDLGLLETARNLKTMDEFEEILKTVSESEKWSYLRPIQYANGANIIQPNANLIGTIDEISKYETLGDTIGIIRFDEETGKVGLAMEADDYKVAADTARRWQELGYLYYDVTAETTSMEDLVKSDILFSWIAASEFGAEDTKTAISGYQLVAVELCSGGLTADNCSTFCYGIPTTAKEPEAAIAFLNLAIKNAEINNLLAWGQEGVDFQVTDGVADYIPGNENPSYHLFDYSVPNQFLVYPWAPAKADFRTLSEENFLKAEASPYLGMVVDLSEVVNEVAAVTTVYNEYNIQIGSGLASEELVQEYIDKLYDAGAQKIIDAYQAAVDAWNAQ